MPTTAFTAQTLTQLGEAAGLSVTPTYPLKPGHERVYLNGPEAESVFGIAEFGRQSRLVLRGWLQFGNEGEKRRYNDPRKLQRALQALAAERTR